MRNNNCHQSKWHWFCVRKGTCVERVYISIIWKSIIQQKQAKKFNVKIPVGLVTQTDWIDYLNCFDHKHLIKYPILFSKYLGPLKLYKNGFAFKICVWISAFRRKRDTWLPRYQAKSQSNSFGHPVNDNCISMIKT